MSSVTPLLPLSEPQSFTGERKREQEGERGVRGEAHAYGTNGVNNNGSASKILEKAPHAGRHRRTSSNMRWNVFDNASRSFKEGSLRSGVFERRVSEELAHVPYWFMIVGGGAFNCPGVSWKWKTWAVTFTLGLWAYNIFLGVIVLIPELMNTSVFGVFVVVDPETDITLLRVLFKAVTIMTSIVHLLIHTWVLSTPWRRHTPIHYSSSSKDYLQKRGLSRSDVFVSVTVLLTLIALLVGNLVNPGNWSLFENFFLWSLCGTLFTWLPFVIPFAMLLDEVENHVMKMEAFTEYLAPNERRTSGLISAPFADSVYFEIWDSMEDTTRRFAKVMPCQVIILGVSLLGE